MNAYNCTECQDTGKRILPNGEHSNCLDCSCEATTERAAMDVAAMDYIQAYEGDLQHAPEDVRWFVHQRAVKMQAARIAELESRIEFNGDHSQDGIVKRDERIADLERQLRNAKFAENLDAENKAFFASLRAPSAPAVEQQFKLDDIEQYRMQMAGISTAAIGYWKEGDSIHPDYDTIALRDVAKLYAKYDALYKASEAAAPQAAGTDKVQTHKDVEWLIESAEIDKKNPALAAEIRAKCKAASAAVDTDKVREAILKLNPHEKTVLGHAHGAGAYCEGFDHGIAAAAELVASMAPQAPVREVPEGWKLVPPQMTDEMWHAWQGCSNELSTKEMDAIYAAMLAAAPLPAAPVQQEGASNG